MMKYVRRNPYLKFGKGHGGRVKMKNFVTQESWEVSAECAGFLRALNGRRNPYKSAAGLDRTQVDKLLDFCEQKDWLYRGPRVMPAGVGTVLCTMLLPEIKRTHRVLAALWNRLLMIFCIPLLLAGIGVLFLEDWSMTTRDGGILAGYVTGIAAGLVIHELSHACACLAYGGNWYEAGLLLRFFLPGAYVVIDYEQVRNRFKRAQILAAGVESNLALAGIFLLLLKTGLFDSLMLILAALNNVFLGLINLAFVDGLDGMGVIAEFLGTEKPAGKAWQLLRNRRACRQLKRKGINGSAVLICCYLIAAFQVMLPVLILLNVIQLYSLLWT